MSRTFFLFVLLFAVLATFVLSGCANIKVKRTYGVYATDGQGGEVGAKAVFEPLPQTAL